MNADIMATVLRVACLTEDRDPNEQRAMLDLAMYVDSERGRFSPSNRRPCAPSLVDLVEDTYERIIGAGRRVTLTSGQRAQYDRLRQQWSRCLRCKHPMGAHYLNDVCPFTPADLAWLQAVGL